MEQITIHSLENIRQAARTFVETYIASPFGGRPDKATVFAFHGEMGAGKTTFIKAICEELGVEDVINSPTFAIINEYGSQTMAKPVYHFDFYRVGRPGEAEELGVSDYFYSKALCFVEWPEKIEELLPPDTAHVSIRENPGGSRTIEIN
jgi:tRNA threonylcarbamoyladenosine biosynthesis protein TsaE